jgi:hypothetical protein
MKALVVYSYYDYLGKQCFGDRVFTFQGNYPTANEIEDVRQCIHIDKIMYSVRILNIIRLEE